jgi:hypothetical protein
MTRWLSSLVERFWAWCEEQLADEDERTDPPHAYAQPGTIGSYRYGNRCLYCDTRDDQRREHNEIACTRSYQELA